MLFLKFQGVIVIVRAPFEGFSQLEGWGYCPLAHPIRAVSNPREEVEEQVDNEI